LKLLLNLLKEDLDKKKNLLYYYLFDI